MFDEAARKAHLQKVGNTVRFAFASKGGLRLLHRNHDALLLVAAMSRKPKWGELRALLLRNHTAAEINQLVEIARVEWDVTFPGNMPKEHHDRN